MLLHVFADTHGKFIAPSHCPDAASSAEPILFLHTGDFSNFGNLAERFFDPFADWGPVYYVSGNHESCSLCSEIDTRFPAHCLDYAWGIHNDVVLVGLAGWDMLQPCRENNIQTFQQRLADADIVNGSRFAILLTHEPPWPWRLGEKVLGSTSVRDFIHSFPFHLVLTGHFHEKAIRTEYMPSNTPVINPGKSGCSIRVFPQEFRLDASDALTPTF